MLPSLLHGITRICYGKKEFIENLGILQLNMPLCSPSAKEFEDVSPKDNPRLWAYCVSQYKKMYHVTKARLSLLQSIFLYCLGPLSFGKIQDEKYGAIYYTTQRQRIIFDSCYKFPTYCFICEKSVIDYIYTCNHHSSCMCRSE